MMNQQASNNTNHNLFISLEGNIGSGKSTLLKELENRLSIHNKKIIYLPEPLDEWDKIKDASGISMLQKFYTNPEKYAFPFQMMAFVTRLSNIKKAFKENDNAIIISERSLFTDKYVFAQMLFDQEKMEDVNFQIYLKCYQEFVEDYPIHYLIYVKTDPTICYERIQKRARIGEEIIPLSYLTDCHNYHESFIQNIPTQKLILNGNEDIFHDKTVLEKWNQQVKELLEAV